MRLRARRCPETIALSVTLAAAWRYRTLRQQFEPQRARHWCCFYQTYIDNVTQPVHGTAARADQRVARLVVVVIFRAKRADRNQPISAGILQLHEQAGAGDAGDSGLKTRADLVGQEMRDEPVGGFAL